MPEKKTFEQAKLELETKFPHLEVIEDTFINTKSKLTILDKECGKVFYRSFNSIMNSNYPGHPDNQQYRIEQTWLKNYGTTNPRKVESIRAKTKQTVLDRYGVENVSQVKEFHEKASKSMNNSFKLIHWKTGQEIICVGKYEACVVHYLNINQIDFIWKPLDYICSNGKHYFVDMYLPDKNLYVEIKGRFYKDAKFKWDEFHTSYPNSEVWSKKELYFIGITDVILQYRIPKYIKESRPKVHGRLGKTFSSESITKMREAKLGKKASKETKLLLSEIRKGKITQKSIPLIDQFGNIFANARIAGQYYGLHEADVKKASAKGKSIKGILFSRTKWEYLDV